VLELWLGWPARGGGGQYPVVGSSGGHVGGCPTVENPPHGITGVGPV
jgi:hypothetical protein